MLIPCKHATTDPEGSYHAATVITGLGPRGNRLCADAVCQARSDGAGFRRGAFSVSNAGDDRLWRDAADGSRDRLHGEERDPDVFALQGVARAIIAR